jgi:hypothetical protein
LDIHEYQAKEILTNIGGSRTGGDRQTGKIYCATGGGWHWAERLRSGARGGPTALALQDL